MGTSWLAVTVFCLAGAGAMTRAEGDTVTLTNGIVQLRLRVADGAGLELLDFCDLKGGFAVRLDGSGACWRAELRRPVPLRPVPYRL